ncbi:MAG: cob(I)yrinic acid a,c-diamide adenosyltransferase [Candidatus Omnitrophota bacterium]
MIHIYTGEGKGKTTAALGLALRAAGAGLRVYIGQFLKRGCFSEIKALKKFKNITVEQFGSGTFVKGAARKKDRDLSVRGLAKVKEILHEDYDVVILDEIIVALNLKLVSWEKTVSLINDLPSKVELVLTGRGCPRELLRLADLVSEIREIKHYLRRGIRSRRGFEL